MSTERDHLDAETVAAWLDGGLDAVSLAAAEAHASNCERCQALLATVVKTDVQLAPGFSRGIAGIPRLKAGANWWRWWMAPLAATAAAVTLWTVVPQQQLQQKATTAPQADADFAPTPAGARARDEAAQMAQGGQPPAATAEKRFDELKRKADASPAEAKAPAAQSKLGAAASANMADAAAAKDRRDAKNEEQVARLEAEPARVAAAPAASAPSPAAPPAARAAEAGALRENAPATQLRKQSAPLEFVSPDPRRRWRVDSNGIERSEDRGLTWMLVRLAQGETITAGASPSPMVCWLVGRGGLVLVATDGTNFTRIPFPETADLAAVSSPELRIAVVTTADGRVFRTENAGRSWIRQ